MSASDRTPTGDPLTDPTLDSDLGLPHTYVRTDGDELVTERDRLAKRNARDGKKAIAALVEELA